MPQPQVSIADEVNLARVGYDKLCPFTVGLPDIHTDYRVSIGGVGADSKDTFGIADVVDRVGHSSATECRDQTGHSGGMSETGTVVNIVCAQYRPGEFLHDIIVLVSDLG